MKKVFSIVLAMVLTLALSVSVCAAPGQFVNSPSNNDAPTIISFERNNEECTGELIITPYNQRKTLPTDLKTLIEKAYNTVSASERATLLHEAEAMLMEQLPVIPIVFNQSATLTSKKLSKVGANYYGAATFSKAQLKNYEDYLPEE